MKREHGVGFIAGAATVLALSSLEVNHSEETIIRSHPVPKVQEIGKVTCQATRLDEWRPVSFSSSVGAVANSLGIAQDRVARGQRGFATCDKSLLGYRTGP